MSLNRRYFLFGALAAPALAAKKNRAAVERPNIVLLVARDVGAYMIGCYGNTVVRTPDIDRLALTGVRFSNHFASIPVTSEGSAGIQESLLSGALGAAGYNCAPPTAKAEEFLDAQSPDKPFFVSVQLPSPLSANISSADIDLFAAASFETIGWEAAASNATHKDMLRDMPANLRKYTAGLAAMDKGVGRVVAKVTEKRLSDNTLIIFIAGNGCLLGHHGLWGDSAASQPPNMYEEVVRVPLIWSWPLRFPPQTVRNEVTATYDLLPTISELTGTPPPAGAAPAGRSYLTFAYGRRLPKKQAWPGVAFARAANVEMAREDRYKLIVRDQGKGPNELYDEVADAREATNQYDNPQFVSVRDNLAAALAGWRGKKS